MGIPERKERERSQIIEAIVQASLDILATEGYAALSVRRIAARIEYSTGVIYHYFQDKDEIIRAVAERGYRQILDRIEQTAYDPEQPIEGIKAFFMAYFSLMLSNRNLAKVALLGDLDGIIQKATVLPEGISRRSPTFRVMTTRLEAAMERGLIRRADPELTAQLIWTSAYGLLARLILEKDTGDAQRQRLMDELFNLLEKYLRP